MIEIRWHGRGGQGGVTAASLAGAAAALYEGRYAQSFPAFGTERRGAPVLAFTRIDDRPFRQRSQVYYPDCVVVFDESLLEVTDVLQGLKEGGHMVINSPKSPEDLGLQVKARVFTVDATSIALKVLGNGFMVNTAMLGAFCGATGIIALDSIKKAIASGFKEGRVAARNMEAAEAAYQQVKEGIWREGFTPGS